AHGALDPRVPRVAAIDPDEVPELTDRGEHGSGCDADACLARLSGEDDGVHVRRQLAPEQESSPGARQSDPRRETFHHRLPHLADLLPVRLPDGAQVTVVAAVPE